MMVVIIALAPDHAVVELNDQAVWRVYSAGIPRPDPESVRGEPVRARTEGLVSRREQVQVPAVLCHVGRVSKHPLTIFHTDIMTCEIRIHLVGNRRRSHKTEG